MTMHGEQNYGCWLPDDDDDWIDDDEYGEEAALPQSYVRVTVEFEGSPMETLPAWDQYGGSPGEAAWVEVDCCWCVAFGRRYYVTPAEVAKYNDGGWAGESHEVDWEAEGMAVLQHALEWQVERAAELRMEG